LLLDSHALYWFLRGDRKLSGPAKRAIENGRNELFASAVTGYELTLKAVQGGLDPAFLAGLEDYARRGQIRILPVTMEHAVVAAELPGPHGDPWDRILMAQARIERLIVVTRDKAFSNYGFRVLW
jgi:PIN domain nuclease of toxin-antitoxin system